MKIRVPNIKRFQLGRSKILLVTLAVFGIGLAGFVFQDRYIANRTVDNGVQIEQAQEQQHAATDVAELQKIQDSSIANPNAKPGEIGEILLDQPNKGIKYIRAGTLILSPSTLRCYVGGYSCSTHTASASDGRPIMGVFESSNPKIGVTCHGDCYGAIQKTSHKNGLEFSAVGPGTYAINLKATHIDPAGNHLLYFGTLTLVVQEPDPGYVAPPEPTYDLGTPPYPSVYAAPCSILLQRPIHDPARVLLNFDQPHPYGGAQALFTICLLYNYLSYRGPLSHNAPQLHLTLDGGV